MNKIFFITFLFVLTLAAAGCASRPKIDRIEYKNHYITIPEEMLICPPPPFFTKDELASIQSENDYNEKFVWPLYQNNETCYNTIKQIKTYSAEVKKLNDSK